MVAGLAVEQLRVGATPLCCTVPLTVTRGVCTTFNVTPDCAADTFNAASTSCVHGGRSLYELPRTETLYVDG